jgi:hypothetical protein
MKGDDHVVPFKDRLKVTVNKFLPASWSISRVE